MVGEPGGVAVGDTVGRLQVGELVGAGDGPPVDIALVVRAVGAGEHQFSTCRSTPVMDRSPQRDSNNTTSGPVTRWRSPADGHVACPVTASRAQPTTTRWPNPTAWCTTCV